MLEAHLSKLPQTLVRDFLKTFLISTGISLLIQDGLSLVNSIFKMVTSNFGKQKTEACNLSFVIFLGTSGGLAGEQGAVTPRVKRIEGAPEKRKSGGSKRKVICK